MAHLRISRGHGSTSSSGTSTPYLTGNADASGSITPVEEDTLITDKSVIISEKLRRRSSFTKPKRVSTLPTRAIESVGLSQEHKEQGRVKVEVYVAYIKAASRIAFGLFMLATIIGQVVSVGGNFALRAWGEHNRETGSNDGMFKYILAYGLLSLTQVRVSSVPFTQVSLIVDLSGFTFWCIRYYRLGVLFNQECEAAA